MRNRVRFQPGVDVLEGRELLTNGPGVGPLGLVSVPGTQAAGITAASATQAVVQIKNLTSAPVTFSFRWSLSLLPTTTTLLPGYAKIYAADLVNGLFAEVRFDRSAQPGVQDKTMRLAYATYGGSGIPPASAAKTYAFQNVAGGVDLSDRVTARAVVGFKNLSNSTVLLQFRWSNTSSWSPTIKLAPGKVQYFWVPMLNASVPEVRYDQSAKPGWQLQTYGLAYDTYTGAGTPPFSSARVYTFRGAPGGVNLYR